MSLLTAFIVKNSHILAGIYFIFLKKGPGPNSKGFQCQIWTSVKRSEKQLSSKTNFSALLQISCVIGLRFTKIVKQMKLEVVWGDLESRSLFKR